MKTRNIIKKMDYILKNIYWFVLYDLLSFNFKRIWHLFTCMIKHYILKTPYAIIIETGNTCNFHCATCPTPHSLIYKRRQPQNMDLDKYKRIIDNVKKYVHVVYVYNSNEPLLHPDIVEMIKYASSRNMHTMISTNCSLLTREKTEELLSSGLGEIRFAFDGLDKDSFEGFRCGGNFEIVKHNIEYFCKRRKELKKKRPITTLQFILNKLNQNQISDIKKFAKHNFIDRLYIKPFILSEYAYSEEQIKELSVKFYPDIDIDDEYIVYKKDQNILKPVHEYKKCPDVDNVFTVLADGRAVMCCFDLYGDYVYGEMDKIDLYKLWKNDKSVNLRNKARERGFSLCKICGNIE